MLGRNRKGRRKETVLVVVKIVLVFIENSVSEDIGVGSIDKVMG